MSELGAWGYIFQLCQMLEEELYWNPETEAGKPATLTQQIDPIALRRAKFHKDQLWPCLEIVTADGRRYVQFLFELENYFYADLQGPKESQK